MGSYFYACMWFCSYKYSAPLGGPLGGRSSAISQKTNIYEQNKKIVQLNSDDLQSVIKIIIVHH